MTRPAATSLAMSDVDFVRDGRRILEGIDVRVESHERWVVLGANGSGKTSLIRLAALYEHPSAGSVEVLGERLGSTDVRTLRQRIGYMSASLADALRPQLTAAEVVMTAKYAALEPWWHRYEEDDRSRAGECLERMAVASLAARAFGSLSSGEQQRVLLARTLMNDPGLILLDEPSARLDLAGRENLVRALGDLAGDAQSPPLVLVTHHVNEIPRGITHALLLRQGRILRSGPIDQMMTAPLLADCFGLDLHLERRVDGRYAAWAV